MVNRNKFILFLLFLLIIAIPVSFASEINGNVTSETSTMEVSLDENISASDDNEIMGAESHVYFDASATTDGSGSQNSPYKTLNGRLSGYTHYHFAPGEYTISSKPYSSSSTMNIIGDNPETTILRFTGSGNFFSGISLNLTGVTLKNMNIVASGITATNTIFDSSKADVDLETSSNYNYGNSYGGAIKISGSSSGNMWDDFWSQWGGTSYSSSTAKFDHCVFRNNYAAYGGAFYIDGATVNISNSKFELNHAPNGGGAISAVNNAKLTLDNCEFNGDYSSYDGGVVYLFNNTQATIKSSTFNNCSAALGSAITSINSQTTVIGSNFNKNKVLYAGGAIYAMYGTLTVDNSNFDSNYAVIGGAIYADALTDFNVLNSKFNNNEALKAGGAILSCANNKSAIRNPTYSNNRADDLYESSYLDVLIGSEDYEMMSYKSDFTGFLPSKYDLRSLGYVSPLEDQNNSGNCWAYATIAALESCILKASGKTFDLSEGNLKNLAQRYSNYGWTYETNNGGFYEMVMGYLTGWLGPVNATNDPADDWDVIAPVLNSVVHIQNILFLQRTSYTDNAKIKEAIMKYGAVATEIYMDFSGTYYNSATYGYYVNTQNNKNHAICVVGWDDTYSKNNFRTTAPGDGAWIVKNSYGTRWGNNGFGYVSYYDTTLFAINNNQLNSYTFILNDTIRFNKNYQYDMGFTDYFIDGHDTIWCKNIYTSQGNDNIAAFSTFFNDTCDWQAFVYVNDELKHTQTGTGQPGYYTFNFNTLIPVNAGDKFAVALKIHSDNYAKFAISEKTTYGLSHEHHGHGMSYYSSDGIEWTDLYGFAYNASDFGHLYYSQAACLKVFTCERTTDLIETVLKLDSFSSKGIVVSVKTKDGLMVNSGNVNFIIDENSYTFKVINGKASADLYLKPGNHSVYAEYIKNNSYNSSQLRETFEIKKENLILKVEAQNIVYGQKLVINLTLTNLNGEVVSLPIDVKLNETICEVNNNQVIISYLNVGKYVIKVSVNSTDDYNAISTEKTIEITKANPDIKIFASDIYEGQNARIIVYLPDNATGNVSIRISKYSSLKTPVNGSVIFEFEDFKNGIYNYTIGFIGDEYYKPILKTGSFKVLKLEYKAVSFTLSNLTKYVAHRDKFEIIILDDNQKPVSELEIYIKIGNFTYKKISDNEGKISMDLNLPGGFYDGIILFNDLNKTFKINIVSSIDSMDIIKDYGRGIDFNATFYDAEGNVLANKEVLFIINGNDYFVKTDDKGMAILNNRLYSGDYTIMSVNPATGETKKNSIKIIKRLTAGDVVVDYSFLKNYKVRVFDDNGNPVSFGETVSITFNGKIFRVQTNKYGYATFKISGLLPKTYTITSEYKGVKISNKVTVKQVLKAKNAKYKRFKAKKYTATLKTSLGKAIKGKKIIFKIKGKTYTAKTNKKGVATIKIKKLTKVGKYKITIKYLKTSISKTITIKR